MGRKPNAGKSKQVCKSKKPDIESLLLNPEPNRERIESRYSPDSLHHLKSELNDAINNIYSKFIERFRELKEIRISINNPLICITAKDLEIEKNYCNELTQKIKQLVHLECLNDIYCTFCKSVIKFTSEIFLELKEICDKDPHLQLACLAEAYRLVENSYKELGKVTSGIFDQQASYVTCENVTKLAFFDKVMRNYKEFLENLRPSGLELVESVGNIEVELRKLAESVKGMDRKCKSVGNQKGLTKSSSSSSFCVDEIVNYITGNIKDEEKKGKRRRASKASTAETSDFLFRRNSTDVMWRSLEDVNSYTALDREIEEFQSALDSDKPLRQKLKPSLSEEWLKKIRSQILKNN